jgi:peroxiredoxin
MSKPTRTSRRLPILHFQQFVITLLVVVTAALAGCREDAATSSSSVAASAAASAAPNAATPVSSEVASTPRVHADGETAARNPQERPIPAFEGRTVDGTRLSVRDLLGTRLVLFFFNPETEGTPPVSQAIEAIAAQSGSHNFKVIGIGIGSDSTTVSRFVASQGLTFPVIDDSGGDITNLLRLRAPNVLLGVDAEGYLSFAIGGFPSEGDVKGVVEADLRTKLRLPEPDSGGQGALYAFPKAPELDVLGMSNGETLSVADLEGRAAAVIFFLHTCPHCHRALASLQETLASMPEESRPRLVAVSVQNSPRAIRNMIEEQGLDSFDPYLDPGSQAAERWGVTGGVPVVIVLDKQGRIRHRSTGWEEKRDPGIVRMKLAKAAEVRVPMLLDPKGYSGNDVCGVCHEQEYATWQYTAHSTAYDTLVTHGAERRTDCVGCHVVGFEQSGGFDFVRQSPFLENVGCESCHGRGGPHLSPKFVPNHDYEQVCATCHNPKHSLGFDYSTFHPRISHKTIAALSDPERAGLLEGGGPSRELLPTQADYVGSDACQSCHQAEFATWQASPHGHSMASLEKAKKAADADCLVCHTTAYGKPGGFQPKASFAAQPDLAKVGCESCHGPGGDHVGQNAKRVGTILSLGDKCDSCVILKVCGTCHDDANDPGFPFQVNERIEAQRHGTIEAAASREGQPTTHDPHTDDSAHLSPGKRPPLSTDGDRALLHEAFERLTERTVQHAGELETDIQPMTDPS